MTRFLFAAAFVLAASVAHAQPSPDLNGDGKVVLSEFQAMQRARMLRADTNGDGKLSKDEMKAAAAAMGRGGGMQLDLFWGMLDGDHDGFLTRPEIDKLSARRFPTIDKNHDGSLDAAELAAARQQRASR